MGEQLVITHFLICCWKFRLQNIALLW